MFCPKCGTSVPENAQVCPNCGQGIELANNVNEQPVISNEPAVGNEPQTNVVENSSLNATEVSQSIDVANVSVEPATSVESMPEQQPNVATQEQPAVESSLTNVEPQPVPATTVFEPQSNEVKPKKNKKMLIIILAIVLVAAIAGVGVFFFLKNASPKKVVDKAITYVFDKVEEFLPEKYDSVSEKFDFNMNINLKEGLIPSEYYTFLNDIKLSGETTVDFQKKNAYVFLDAEYKNEGLAGIKFYTTNDTAYINFGDLYDKYVKIPFESEGAYETIFETNTSTQKHTKTILNEVEKALKASIKEDYLTSTKETVTIDGKDTKVNKHTLTMTEKEAMEMAKIFYETLNNDTFIDVSAEMQLDMYGDYYTKEELKEDIKESLEYEIKYYEEEMDSEYIDLETKLYISLYMDSKNISFIGFDISGDVSEDKQVIVFEIMKKAEDTYGFLIQEDENYKVMSGEVFLGEKETTFKLVLDAVQASMGKTEMSIKMTKGDSPVITYIINAEQLGTIQLNLGNSIKYNEGLTLPDFSGAVDASEITEDELAKISEKLLGKTSAQNLVKDAESLISLLFSTSLPIEN